MRKYIIIILSSLMLSPLFAYVLLHPQEKEVVVVKHKVVYNSLYKNTLFFRIGMN